MLYIHLYFCVNDKILPLKLLHCCYIICRLWEKVHRHEASLPVRHPLGGSHLQQLLSLGFGCFSCLTSSSVCEFCSVHLCEDIWLRCTEAGITMDTASFTLPLAASAHPACSQETWNPPGAAELGSSLLRGSRFSRRHGWMNLHSRWGQTGKLTAACGRTLLQGHCFCCYITCLLLHCDLEIWGMAESNRVTSS